MEGSDALQGMPFPPVSGGMWTYQLTTTIKFKLVLQVVSCMLSTLKLKCGHSPYQCTWLQHVGGQLVLQTQNEVMHILNQLDACWQSVNSSDKLHPLGGCTHRRHQGFSTGTGINKVCMQDPAACCHAS